MQKLLAAALMAAFFALPAEAADESAAKPAVKAAGKTVAKETKKKAEAAAPATTAATAAAADDDSDPEADAKFEAMKKLAKKKKCKEVVMQKEVLPFFGKENTIRASQEITVEWERDDIVSGRAEVLDTHSRCNEIVGSLVVMCTTVTALCYHEEPKHLDKVETLSEIEKREAAAKAVRDKAAENEAARAAEAAKAAKKTGVN